MLPSTSSLNPNQKLKRAMFTTDGCNGAIPARKIAMARVSAGNEGVAECTQMDCHNHMRNVFFTNPIEKALSADLSNLLKDSLSEIDSSLRVGTVNTAFARAYDKEFSQCCNYPKGGGMFFTTYLRKKFPGITLYHVENMAGSRQDIIFMSSLAMALNRPVNVKYLQYCMEFAKKDEMNILRQNLYSTEGI